MEQHQTQKRQGRCGTGKDLYTHLMSDKADVEIDWEETYPGVSRKGKDKGELQFNADTISAFVGLTFFFGGTK